MSASGRMPLLLQPELRDQDRPRPADPALDGADLAPEQGGRLLVGPSFGTDHQEGLPLGLGQAADAFPDDLQCAGVLLVVGAP